jgi:hypothetical protein
MIGAGRCREFTLAFCAKPVCLSPTKFPFFFSVYITASREYEDRAEMSLFHPTTPSQHAVNGLRFDMG